MCPILLVATVVDRFPLALATFQPSSQPHLVLLFGEPAVLALVMAWMTNAPGAQLGRGSIRLGEQDPVEKEESTVGLWL